MIKMVSLRKEFGTNVAVCDLTLEIPKGEFFCIVGPNAAGKTTTIKMLAGLLKPTSGEVFIGGHNVFRNHTEARRLLSYIPDAPYLYDKLTGSEFLKFVGDIYGVDKSKLQKFSEELLQKFGLIDAADLLIESYSHGMKQRLVFCAAFLHEPQVIVIDEPMVGLDPIAIKLVKDSLREKSREGVTIFMSTHTLAIAEEVSDRIGMINRGKLIALGTIEEIREITGSSTGKPSGPQGQSLEDIFIKLTQDKGRLPSL